MMNRQVFFTHVRASLFGGALRQSQVMGIEVIFDEWDRRKGENLTDLAYALATTFLETGPASKEGHMQPIFERGPVDYFDKYEPGTRIGKVLGNTQKGDGFRFRGRGLIQLTGRSNYAKAKRETGVDLIEYPDKALDPKLAARIMFDGMTAGWFTGKKFSDYLRKSPPDFKGARAIINGHDKDVEIAGYATKFYSALQNSIAPDMTVEAPEAPLPPPGPAPESVPLPTSPSPGRWGFILTGLFVVVVLATGAFLCLYFTGKIGG